MTPLIRETIRWVSEAGLDPTTMHWFDISSLSFEAQTPAQADWLVEYRPPFDRCMIVWRGKTKHHAAYEMWMQTAGDDPAEGVVVSIYKGAWGERPHSVPAMVYLIDGDTIRYGPADDAAPVAAEEATLMLALLSHWYAHLAKGCETHTLTVKDTHTNRRKIAAGKVPTYDWRTVVIGPVKATSESRGGTHASPRQHDRRGHLRRLRSGKNVWVKQCRVGSAERGAVFHDYEVRA